MTFETTYFDPAEQIAALAEAAKLLYEASTRDGYHAFPEASVEAKRLVETIANLRAAAWPGTTRGGS